MFHKGTHQIFDVISAYQGVKSASRVVNGSRKSFMEKVMTSLEPKLLRAQQAAAYLSISKSLFYELISEGYLPKGISIRKRCVVWRVDDLNEFVDAAHDQGQSDV